MTTQRVSIEKIPDPQLRRFAQGTEEEPASVIVELEAPEPQVRFEKSVAGSRGVPKPSEVAFSEQDERQMQEAASQTQEFLERVLQSKPKWLRSAQAFVVWANAQELREIAAFPFIRAIHPNRPLRHKSPAK